MTTPNPQDTHRFFKHNANKIKLLQKKAKQLVKKGQVLLEQKEKKDAEDTLQSL